VGDLELTQDTFRGNVQGWRNWLMPTRDGIAGNAAKLRQLARESLAKIVAAHPERWWVANDLARYQSEEVPFDPGATFSAGERTYAMYGQGKYRFSLGRIDIDGVVGLRVVNTDGDYSGVSNVTFNGVQSYVPRTVHQNYTDLLPNVSLRIHPTNKLQVRFAFTKTRTRPDFGQLNPAVSISQNNAPVDPANPNDRINAYGSSGNPDLKPLTSKNYDATVEYYVSKNSSLSVAVFYRDLFGFINNYTRRVIDPVYGRLEVSRPENAGAGKIKGVEVGGQAFLDFLPGALSGLGVQANLTYIDGKNRFPTALSTDTSYVRITGLSKWSYNATLIYEKGDISTRLSYNGRSKWVNWYGQSTTDGSFTGAGTKAITRLDYSLNYTPIKSLTLTFDVNNILAKPFNNYNAYTAHREFPIDVRYEGRYFGFGARFRFE
jgi:TonB-dependent receptor